MGAAKRLSKFNFHWHNLFFGVFMYAEVKTSPQVFRKHVNWHLKRHMRGFIRKVVSNWQKCGRSLGFLNLANISGLMKNMNIYLQRQVSQILNLRQKATEWMSEWISEPFYLYILVPPEPGRFITVMSCAHHCWNYIQWLAVTWPWCKVHSKAQPC